MGGSNQKPTVGKVWMFSGATHFRFACFIISGYDDCSEKYKSWVLNFSVCVLPVLKGIVADWEFLLNRTKMVQELMKKIKIYCFYLLVIGMCMYYYNNVMLGTKLYIISIIGYQSG